MGLRLLPFFKAKKGWQFAGGGLTSDGGGGGGGGGKSFPPFSTTEVDTGMKWVDGKSIYMKTYLFDTATSEQYTIDTIDGVNLMFACGSLKYNSDSQYYALPFMHNQTLRCNVTEKNDAIIVISGNLYFSDYKITIFYTKGE